MKSTKERFVYVDIEFIETTIDGILLTTIQIGYSIRARNFFVAYLNLHRITK